MKFHNPDHANRHYLVCVKSEKYAFWINLRPIGFMKQDKVEL